MAAALTITRVDHTAAELRAAASKSRDAAQVRRLLGLASGLEGRPRTAAAEQNGMDQQTLRDWVHRYNTSGIDGLQSRASPGRAPALSEDQRAALKALVIAGPDPVQDKVVRWRCADLREEVARRFNVVVHESTIGKWLHQLGLTRLQARHSTPRKRPRPRRRLKKLPQPGEGGAAHVNGGTSDRDMVPGRGQGRPERDAALCVGADWIAAADGARQPA